MRPKEYHTDWVNLLSRQGEITVSDFLEASPGVPKVTVNARIRALVFDGTLSRIGRGRFIVARKMGYKPVITHGMRKVCTFLINSLPGINHCISEKNGNIIVETERCNMDSVGKCLSEKFVKVAFRKDADRLRVPLKGYILVGQLISEAPVIEMDGCFVESLEKSLVDDLCKQDDSTRSNPIQKAMEIYPVNINRLKRYASRRNMYERVNACLSSLDKSRLETFTKVQTFLAGTDIVKAWVFGSFARGEETPSSDLDLLVHYDSSKRISLLTTIRYKLDLEKIIGREVDLIEESCLKDFAVASANQDKFLIYERSEARLGPRLLQCGSIKGLGNNHW